MASQPVEAEEPIRIGGDFELDVRVRRLRRGNRVVKLERIPLEILVLLLQHRGEIVTRDQIVSRVWGNGVFFDIRRGTLVAHRTRTQAVFCSRDIVARAPERLLHEDLRCHILAPASFKVGRNTLAITKRMIWS